MRSALWGIVVAGSTLAGGLTLGAACGSRPTECIELYTCPLGGGGSPGSSSSTSSSSSTATGTGGGPPATCVPTAGMAPVDNTCGIFVSSSFGADGPNAGSKVKPYKTLAAAIAAAGPAKKPVYACAETFTETLTVAVGVGVYGGLDCTKKWSYAEGGKSTLTTDADAVPLTLSASANGASLFDFKVQAAGAMLAGGSSIAVIADQVTAAFTRCDFIAGNGKDGLAGVMSTVGVGPKSDSTDPLIRGNNGSDACASATMSFGGGARDNALCPFASGGPIGGSGGQGAVPNGGPGDIQPVATMQTALGGQGETSAGWGCFGGSGLADGGANGQAGPDGLGAAGLTSLGTFGISGYVGVSGAPGDLGKPGQGGAGGGGAKGKAGCAGASGGGGGAGGCGGHGGTGGQAGGASIALVSLSATLAFDTVTSKLGTGGAGGDGGDSQDGGVGGFGGFGGKAASGTLKACYGGGGGQGGGGGKGGGGRGGHAIGMAATGSVALDTKGVKFSQKGTIGLGGKGGPSQDGDPGVLADVQVFP